MHSLWNGFLPTSVNDSESCKLQPRNYISNRHCHSICNSSYLYDTSHSIKLTCSAAGFMRPPVTLSYSWNSAMSLIGIYHVTAMSLCLDPPALDFRDDWHVYQQCYQSITHRLCAVQFSLCQHSTLSINLRIIGPCRTRWNSRSHRPSSSESLGVALTQGN